MSQYLIFLPVVFLAVTSIVLLMSQNWRLCVLALAVQYLAAFWLVALIWPVGAGGGKAGGWLDGGIVDRCDTAGG